MKRITKLMLIAALALASLPLGAQSALACSCMAPDAQDLFANSDGAFVGTLIDSPGENGRPFANSAEQVPYLFEVEAAYKGEITSQVAVMSAISSASCGLSMQEGARASVFMWVDGGEWHSGLCSTMDAEALLDGPFEAIDIVAADDIPTAPETDLARWALVGIGGIALVGVALVLYRKRSLEG